MPGTKSRAAHPIDIETGANLRSARKAKGLSQMELGRVLGITFQQIQKYERGANRISASMLVQAAHTLGVSSASILPADDAPPMPDLTRLAAATKGMDEAMQLFAAIKSPRLRREIIRLMRAMVETSAGEGDRDLHEAA